MHERVVENWLTNVNEKSFQVPFCQMLTGLGYKVVHLSRHGSFEEGKDVLAIDPDGKPCAFQLKGSESGKITQKEWSKYHDQIIRLVEIPINHPSIDISKPRRVFFVTNGELEEEVRTEITNLNTDWKQRGHPILETMMKGELLHNFLSIHSDLWPTQLKSEKELLELFLANGAGSLDKVKFSQLLETILFKKEEISTTEGLRNLVSAAIFTSYAIFPYSQKNNHLSIIEGWIIYIGSLVSYVEKHKLNEKAWATTVKMVESEIYVVLSEFVKEIGERDTFVEGNVLVDAPFFRGRMTCLLGFISAFVLLRISEGGVQEADKWIEKFLIINLKQLLLWGEAATPQILANIWALSELGYSHLADRLLFGLLKGIVDQNINHEGIPDPYHDLGEVVLSRQGLSDSFRTVNYKGRTYSLEAIIQLITRRDYRGVIAEYWKSITELHFAELEPNESWQYCLWHCEDGILHTRLPNSPQSWSELVNASKIISTEKIPEFLQKHPVIFLIFLIVYPHRLRPDAIKYLDKIFCP